ncbi:hypothetical protein J3Q64DRAFT_1706065 [Phycomyces blakesleeanus]|uniref:Yeast cell wall synthesis Kre9/Knh1-like N-terminal domain-containing protein n=2 Tax=Phycomyces blakesleeanus TaxID=4837 RepID=A0A167PG70_PHYB8|nr:hypothetical protein PHYBLDRAFT_141719 [Phycomyces blakesleeanus NRRL 1555(-)]OAD77854.1 hypothetical protein PHYBLDRAFT_141719 [Phycomyces blakesleeanus NRRL 1555(-)]|eukprot:XP_018295894.1 hypothetical protein PHYBLDRAFT_141719 [Phycomyces blakesleeanus NRRL 1555(-)]
MKFLFLSVLIVLTSAAVVLGVPVPPSTGSDALSIKINLPQPGTVWNAGSFQHIDWKNPQDHASYYNITLYKGEKIPNAYERVLVKDIAADLEFARIHVSEDVVPGDDYWIEIGSGKLKTFVKYLTIKAADSSYNDSSEGSDYPSSEELQKINELPLFGSNGF